MEQQPLDPQVTRIADSLERLEKAFTRTTSAYEQDRKEWSRYNLLLAFLNSFGIGLGLAAFYFFLSK